MTNKNNDTNNADGDDNVMEARWTEQDSRNRHSVPSAMEYNDYGALDGGCGAGDSLFGRGSAAVAVVVL